MINKIQIIHTSDSKQYYVDKNNFLLKSNIIVNINHKLSTLISSKDMNILFFNKNKIDCNLILQHFLKLKKLNYNNDSYLDLCKIILQKKLKKNISPLFFLDFNIHDNIPFDLFTKKQFEKIIQFDKNKKKYNYITFYIYLFIYSFITFNIIIFIFN